MNRAIFLDIDSLLTISDDDIAVLPGVEAALKYYQNQIPRWVMVGISNSRGMAPPVTSIVFLCRRKRAYLLAGDFCWGCSC